MRVPDLIRTCVGFVGYEPVGGGPILLAGTAFFVARSLPGTGYSFKYIVTAKHVIDGIRDQLINKVYLRFNFKDGYAHWLETPIQSWAFHPDDSDVDVAVTALPETEPLDFGMIPLTEFATEERIARDGIGIGDEVVITGLFAHHFGQRKNIPIVRIGNIAAMPEERLEVKHFGLIEAYLIEARSIGGLSGSPVFAHLGISRMIAGEVRFQYGHPSMCLLGLMHGHYDLQPAGSSLSAERVNMGIGIVVPATKILEVINQPRIKNVQDKVEKELRERLLPTADTASENSELTGLTQNEFENILRRVSEKVPEPESEKT